MHPTLALTPWWGTPGKEAEKKHTDTEEIPSPRENPTVRLREEHKDEPGHLTCKKSFTLKELAVRN